MQETMPQRLSFNLKLLMKRLLHVYWFGYLYNEILILHDILTHKRRYRVQQAVQYRTYPSGSTCTMNLFATTALLSELHPGVYLTKSITVLVKVNTFELACKIDRYMI